MLWQIPTGPLVFGFCQIGLILWISVEWFRSFWLLSTSCQCINWSQSVKLMINTRSLKINKILAPRKICSYLTAAFGTDWAWATYKSAFSTTACANYWIFFWGEFQLRESSVSHCNLSKLTQSLRIFRAFANSFLLWFFSHLAGHQLNIY